MLCFRELWEVTAIPLLLSSIGPTMPEMVTRLEDACLAGSSFSASGIGGHFEISLWSSLFKEIRKAFSKQDTIRKDTKEMFRLGLFCVTGALRTMGI